MPNHQKHRGQNPQDLKNFAPHQLLVLCEAVKDMYFLLSRNYPENASLALVGNRYRLNERQRKAVMRASCGEASLQRRKSQEVKSQALLNQQVMIDGYNLLITSESILSKGIILQCLDGCYRDLASVHGTYKRVEETMPAIHWIGNSLQTLQIHSAVWFLDAPISNSGRLKKILLQEAALNQWAWEVELVPNPDKVLAETTKIVISSDSWIVEQSARWFNLMGYMLAQAKEEIGIISLAPSIGLVFGTG